VRIGRLASGQSSTGVNTDGGPNSDSITARITRFRLSQQTTPQIYVLVRPPGHRAPGRTAGTIDTADVDFSARG
jgi:hypothetical protein